VAFVTLAGGHSPQDSLKDDLKTHVGKSIGSFAKPDEIRFTDALPKTRSGKIMRRLLRDLASGDVGARHWKTSVLAKLKGRGIIR
jgi:acetyl-CoA synthetase